MNSSIIFLITGADNINDSNVRRERHIEYSLSLHKIFYYNYPVIGVVSETTNEIAECLPFDHFPFKVLIKIAKGELDGYNKSMRESISIARLLQEIPSIDDNTFIVKVSGRYLIIDDSFIATVNKYLSDNNTVAIIRTAENNTAQYTFLYALRYCHLKLFYQKYINATINDDISVEYRLFEYLKENHLLEHTIMVEKLGILTNINNSGKFQIF